MASGFSGLGALILAAGKGTRMHSDKPKVLQTLLGEPMLAYVMVALASVMGDAVWAVIGHNADMVRKVFPEFEAQGRFVLQEQQLGTGHALQMAWPTLRAAGLHTVVVVNGDTPLLPAPKLVRVAFIASMISILESISVPSKSKKSAFLIPVYSFFNSIRSSRDSSKVGLMPYP